MLLPGEPGAKLFDKFGCTIIIPIWVVPAAVEAGWMMRRKEVMAQ